jgi:hypothetical protein
MILLVLELEKILTCFPSLLVAGNFLFVFLVELTACRTNSLSGGIFWFAVRDLAHPICPKQMPACLFCNWIRMQLVVLGKTMDL